MKDLFLMFNSYNLRARISVVIILIAPVLLELYLLIPEFRELSSTIILVIIVFALCNVLIICCRVSGVEAMKKCFPTDMPAQKFLLPSDDYIDRITKERYYKFLSKKIEAFNISSIDESMTSTAVSWLIAQTRDSSKFPLILEENINFGVSYNLLGLKIPGLILSSIGLLVNVLIFILNLKTIISFNIQYNTIIISIFLNLLFLLFWIFLINKNLVKNAGKKYGRALLAACDSPFLQ